jgi:3-deoxy-D-manno-octulosonic-acid transferase
MSLLTDMVYGVGAAVTAPLWGYRLWRTGKWRTDWPARFGHATLKNDPARKTLLIHAVSVGEIGAIRRLVEQLHAHHDGQLRIVIATTTDTGYQQAVRLYGSHHTVVRYPLDFTRSVRRFLDAIRPDAVALVELEVWPTFVAECRRRDIPVAVINGRLSERSWRRYRLIRPLVAPSFARLAAAAVQDADYAARFVDLGAEPDRVHVMGTMKWDTATIADDVAGSEALAAAMGIDRAKPLIVCGSTGPGEEGQIVDALRDIPAQLLLVPRKPERFDEVAAQLAPIVRRTRHADGIDRPIDGQRLFLLDTLGELRKAYALADVVVVGRTFVPLGGSDMIEPVALGKPTLVGPHTKNFASSMEPLLAGGGIVQLQGIDELPNAVARLLDADAGRALAEKGRAVIRLHQGATARHAKLLENLLNLKLPA